MPTNPKADRNLRRAPTPAPRVTALVSLAATLILTASGLAGATTINANSASQSDVAAAVASAADGDTVTIPGGTASWTRTLQVKRGITIQGAGVGVTIIKDNVASGQLISMTVPAGLTSRVTGIEFQDGGHGGRGGYANNPGLVNAQCADQRNGAQFRFDHNKWNDVFGDVGVDTILGVADHNTFISNGRGSFSIYANHYDGQPNGYDYSWHDPCNFGSANFFFIEDNTFTNTNATNQAFITDAVAGARFVIRHNTSTGYRTGDHGTDSVGRQRGSRCYEVYNNTMDGANLNKYIGGSRASTVLIHDNTISNYWSAAQFSLDAFRTFYRFPIFGGADGTNPWDVNDTTGGRNHNGIYFTGTVASSTSAGGLPTVTVSGNPNWTTNQWYGYVVRRLTDNCNSGTINYAEIASNNSNTLTGHPSHGHFGERPRQYSSQCAECHAASNMERSGDRTIIYVE